MRASKVREVYQDLENSDVQIWIDGGWAVDALLGEQTRPHDDLDIVVEQRNLSKLCQYFADRNYVDVPREDTCAWNFVLGDNKGHQIDIHVISYFDDVGHGIYGPVENGIVYPAGSLTGNGVIDGHAVNCISAEQLVKSHTGYKLQEKDYKDVLALCERFKIEVPDEYRPKLAGESVRLAKKPGQAIPNPLS